jgi:hypothetical protein
VQRAGTGNRARSNRTEAATRKPSQLPPGDYSHCACSRLPLELDVLNPMPDKRNAVIVDVESARRPK